ncbi:hypothetical protein [Oceanobacillus chungangensis]|uniref:Uncharacterized protein n=1 Tax=Oceanobacillus chungangensis TaxID=1229152 RepID=A0A3D8PL32_9BACI|nr:hypothetical protein [Oceanobacillus chungangensis]RDW15959.1 hypothetical protein CWR45_15810 [Oceanobacillus chungangensis]
MYSNLAIEMNKAGLQPQALANVLGITAEEVVRKINRVGKMYSEAEERDVVTDFYATEVYKIKTTFFPYMTYDYLFENKEISEKIHVDLSVLINKLIKTELLPEGVAMKIDGDVYVGIGNE